MKMHSPYAYALFLCLFLYVPPCGATQKNSNRNIRGTWTLEKISYEVGNDQIMEKGNFVEIYPTYIIEVIKNHGRRRCAYSREKNQLTLTSGGQPVIWDIKTQKEREMHILTPIGLYILKR